MKKLVIATRRSRLALWQAEHIAARLRKLHQGLQVELLPMSTRGRRAHRSPARPGRRQGPVREGAGERDGGWPRASRGAFD
jgi:porphobilinogen deaminase